MNKHTIDMLHDPTTHEAIRRVEFLVVLTIAIAILHTVLYHSSF